MKVILLKEPNLLKNNLTPIFASEINLDFHCIHPKSFVNRDIYVNELKKNIENLNYTFNAFDGVEKKSFQIEKDILGNEIINFQFNNKKEKIVFDTTRHKDSKNRKIYEGEIACMLSHYLLWDKLKNSDKEAHFILEDDAQIKMDQEQFKILLSNLPDLNTFDICYFTNRQVHNIKKDINKYYYEMDNGSFNGTEGYLLSKRGLKKLLENFTLYSVADGILGALINEKKLKAISSNEKPIHIINNIPSMIWNEIKIKKCLTIASCQGYDYKTISPWINSLNSCGFKGDKVIIGIDASDELEKQITRAGVYCYKVKSTENKNRYIERFKHIADFLKIFQDSYDYIITTDIKDVIFQKNPEEWIRNNIKNNNIIASSESIKIKDENWNKYQIYAALGNEIGKFLENYEAQNIGILAGKIDSIFKISEYIYYQGLKCSNTNGDQPLFNYIIHNELKEKTLFANHDNGWSLNCGVAACDRTEKEFKKHLLHNIPHIDSNNIIRNFKNEEICIIHQYDRNSLWKDNLLKKYS